MTPMATKIIPMPLFKVNNSLNKNREKIIIKIGNVIDIRERLIAVVVCPAKYIRVLNVVIPNNAVNDRYKKCFFTTFHSEISFFNAKGKKTRTATTHRQKASAMGGILSLNPLAIIKFADHIAVAPIANI